LASAGLPLTLRVSSVVSISPNSQAVTSPSLTVLALRALPASAKSAPFILSKLIVALSTFYF